MINLLSLDQLAHKAYCEDNALALAILAKLDNEVSEAVRRATEKNDADYHYEIRDAVNAIECLIGANWYKAEETKFTKDRIIYMIEGFHEDTSPYKNHVELSKPKGCDEWTLIANAGQYGEDCRETTFTAKGFKDAQDKATKYLVAWIKGGMELNLI